MLGFAVTAVANELFYLALTYNCCLVPLQQVAAKQLATENLGTPEIKTAVCNVFVTAHQSVEATSAKMFAQLKRRNYVTPTNYLETVRNYRGLITDKRTDLAQKANKLKGGLQKLDETTVQVNAMKVIAEEKKVVVAQAKVECEDLLKDIVVDKRAADEQEKQVRRRAWALVSGSADEFYCCKVFRLQW